MSAIKRLNISKEVLNNKKDSYSDLQEQTKNAFRFKWDKRDSYESDRVKDNAKRWLLERYGNNNSGELAKWFLQEKKIILDAGCGSGFSAILYFGELLNKHDYLGVDISESIHVAKQRFAENNYSGDFIQSSILDLSMIPEKSIDMIFSEGVLHHTDSVKNSLLYLFKKLKKGGYFLFYVYLKKAVIREYTDDYIRNYLNKLDDKSAWEELRSLTKLGAELGRKNIEINIQDDIPYLGIKKGKIDLQRFFYWNICKMFYHPEYSLEEMNHINFDWFRPLNCHRHTKEEILLYCQEANLQVKSINIQESGITIVAKKR